MKHKILLLILFSTLGLVACKKPLKEVPLDFYSPENAYTNKAQFQSALAHIYLNVRTNFYATTDAASNYDMLGYDVDLADNRNATTSYIPYFNWNTLNADNGFSSKWWGNLYGMIAKANTVIDRAELPAAVWSSPEEKNAIVAEAKFLRAFCYHFLANIYGGVPLVINETKVPKFDYTRSSQEEVYQLCKSDLEFAVKWMPGVHKQTGGRAPREAAFHLLSEVKICMKDYQGAISAADSVINGANNSLMQNRFGAFKNFTFSGPTYKGAAKPYGDVYFDLFQDGNFNWVQGNKEAIWNIEQDPNILGGDNVDVNASGGFFTMERWWGPIPWTVKDVNGVSNFLMDTLMGRPVGTLIATKYADSLIWRFKGDWNKDIRNSAFNVQRTWYYTNPASKFYGQPITEANSGAPSVFKVVCSPQFKKVVSAVHYHKFQDATSKQWHDNGRTYKDWYIMRLAETYLLRAEANLLNGNLGAAAEDINAVRRRAQATPVDAGEVTLDLILDERARELYQEEFRLNTLMRMGKLAEYLNKYNGYMKFNGYTADAHLNKMPIPNSVIQANKGAVMTQNPGY
ncbi:RagB/SusD family nutrient uptake outer membrane protein [Pedobacter gandavensis]|uniref:RagB/SusD family nutrient uptake outer membrane protein n=1 Tax=Pedobacter gandavensis TaxID=2679963 RepID=A0ABR6EQQ9_9SPHI|nr:RagB/SusD family nutrient uptake outer membrane protein [Pedobacter gandavensis]MBB2147581.1 RagB/SusD family nutrient uptake outer membrane protein [Pedobacter gandavensis]